MSTLSYSDFSSDNKVENFTPKKRKNKTIKRKSTKVREFLNSMGEDDDDSNLADFDENFSPPPSAQITREPDESKEALPDTDSAIGMEGFSKLSTDQASNQNYQNYFNTYIPYASNPQNSANLHGSKDELMKKLNYMIHLLEETKDEKTQNVTEELVLYMFLGVFTIFVVDSFARAGKYTR
uniref:Uncharacterized protein n=1 Tax=viral metagenome TaxID=1070528 RepID=A0A6C0J9P0_9ZZZZ|tara:strand:- start:2667 stop:3209 length:543 start_codon:yes stop_codon:yes gene_type:complete